MGRGVHAGQPLYSLQGLREALGLTQVEVSARSGMTQGNVSQLERKTSFDAVLVATLRKYASALGGEVQLVVVIDGKRYVLSEGE